MPDARKALEAAIANAVLRHDVPVSTLIAVLTDTLAMLINEAPYSAAEKHEVANLLATRLHEAADA